MVATQRLVADSKFLDELPVLFDVDPAQIVQEALPLADHLQQAAPAMMVLGMRTKMMIVEMVDPLGEQRHLHLAGAGVGVVAAIGGDELALLRCADQVAKDPLSHGGL